jgi:diguanylate cyclase (GGDEF)-like protein/PAS domain S-box-containing protein
MEAEMSERLLRQRIEALEKELQLHQLIEKQLEAGNERLESLLNKLPLGIVVIDFETRKILDVNPHALSTFGCSLEQLTGKKCTDYICPAHEGNCPIIDQGLDLDRSEREIITFNGERIPVLKTVMKNEIDGHTVLLECFIDISDRKTAEKALRASEEKHRLLFENAVEGIFQTTPEGRFLSVNPSFLRVFGFNSQEELLLHFTDVGKQQYLIPEDREKFKQTIDAKGEITAFETQLLNKAGSPIWVSLNARAVRDETGVLLYYEGFLQDITERKKAQEELYRISIHDHLTCICNRRYIFERLDAMVNEYQRETRHFSVSIIDLDYFKNINDTHGHPAGDFILREFAAILSGSFRPYDLVGRYGGEEFVVVMMNVDILQTQKRIEGLRQVINTHVFDFNGIPICIAFSAGVAHTGETGMEITVENLVRKADERLYLAKEQGRDRIVCG